MVRYNALRTCAFAQARSQGNPVRQFAFEQGQPLADEGRRAGMVNHSLENGNSSFEDVIFAAINFSAAIALA